MSSEMELKKLRNKRGQCKATITRLETFLSDATNVKSSSIDSLEARREKLLSTFKEYESIHLDILNLDDEDVERVSDVEEQYFLLLGKINCALRELKSKQDIDLNSVSSCKLPSIEISVFDGKDFTQYKPFIDLFKAVIDMNSSLSNVQKLFYLRKYLTGDALSVIINLPLVNESYPEALNLLNKRFDNHVRIISNHINILLDLPQMQKGTAAHIRAFISSVRQQLYALQNMEQPVDQWDMLLISVLSRKLDSYTNRAYHLDRPSPDTLPTLNEFLSFLEKRAIALEDSVPTKSTQHEVNSKFKSAHSYTVQSNNNVSNVVAKPTYKPQKCGFCNNNHPLYSCPKFKMAFVGDRLTFVTENKLCILCLRSHTDKCKYNFRCRSCKLPHNTLLHEEKPKEEEVVNLHSNQVTNSIDENSNSNYSQKTILLPTIRVKFTDNAGCDFHVKALLDSGSQVSIVKRDLVKQLNLTPMAQETNIISLGNTPNKVNELVNLQLNSPNYDVKFKVKCHVVNTITGMLPQNYFDITKCTIPSNIQLADTEFNVPSEISILLGADFYFAILLNGHIKLTNGLVLQNTLFGHVVAGSTQIKNFKSENSDVTLVSNFLTAERPEHDDSLEKIMKNFWIAEKIPEGISAKNDEFLKAEYIFKESVKLEDNHFSVDYPLKCPIEELEIGESFSLALQRFYALEKKFETNNEYFQAYKKFIDEYIGLGHAKEVDINQYDVYNDPVYFLAHHAVLNESSKTTKLRVVFGGNMKAKNGLSVNDVMLNGPIVQNDLFNILMLFRTYPYTLMCDIEKMFRMCSINEKFKSLQNILWRDHPSKPVSCLQLQTITYGLKASTFLSTRCLIELAHLYQDKYPLAAEALKLNTYVDDVICGADSAEQLLDLKNELVELMKLGNFNLHKWCSNSPLLLNDIPENKKYFEVIDLNKDNIIKTLGLKYDILADSFVFSCPMTDNKSRNSKREVLSFIGRIFDPLGLIGPLVVRAKLIMQEVWKSKVDWDSTLPCNLLKIWKTFISDLNEMGTIKIPRVVGITNVESVELVGYCDASQHAVGCNLYLRILSTDGHVNVSLLCSKSRVAPLSRKLTIPNLELNGALLLAELSSRVYKTLLHRYAELKVFLYTDSQVVLAWLNSRNLKGVYVSNRVRDIKALTKEFQWFHVKGSDNPADLLSRGLPPHKLQGNQLWWFGPPSLSEKSYKHNIAYEKDVESPTTSQDDPPLNQLVDVCNLQSKLADDDIFCKYSDFNKLQRIIALLLRFKHNCLHPNNKIKVGLTTRELQTSNLVIIRYVQGQLFQKEIVSLQKGISVNTNISGLHPFLDGNGILRVGGRLGNAVHLSYDKKHPIILPKSNEITYMIIKMEHLRLLHAGAKLLLSFLSQRYWIVNGIREVKKVVHKCIKCFRNKAVAAKQLMGSLPTKRISASRPFEITGIDFCGAFQIKVARIRKPIITKAYIALYVCFATKAIHLELVSDLTTAAFLASLQRFIARRGLPSYIYCDNAQTFKGASNKLKELYELNSSKSHVNAVETFCSTNMIQFKFIPSYSPEFGGLWEAGVKSVKHHIKRVIGNVTLTFEEFYTVITQIESILNSRPLLPISSDISDLNYLTPGHFLIGVPLTSYPELDLTDKNINRLRFWDLCSRLKQDFWKLWSRDYLTSLQNRPKWKKDQVNLKDGDLVIVKNKDLPPYNWPMGRIVKTYPGPDGRVRVADIMMGPKNKVFVRSYTKLCPLPMNEEKV